ncbi:flagellar hook-associated protein FlgK [Arthrobacter sp. C9C5]|uniref:flagellar hook-associated protein FlgK n=1 Tax=Arthrobacter sp. C9C5 TaxID=2735267 RepID=UPI001585D199|nr:flagellar hook-associated protein FlgK [Arthrobacter sp. C9C5]NUU31181.1 flagellar hook-associated protein FlgK [Arthrobacter sp. C9C5]
MSTFGALNTAYRGLTAAQQGMNVAAQNIANAATEGYTRQRVQQSAIAAPAQGLMGSGRPESGNGVSVDGIARLGSGLLDAGVRSSTSQAGYASARSSALQGIEATLLEPGDNGISAALHNFWSAWQGAANQPGESGPAGQLLQAGTELSAKISSGYSALTAQWSSVRGQAQDSVDAVNSAAAQVAALNATIRTTTAAGGSANELIDARAKLTETISRLAGGTVREQADGTVDVHVGGNALVMGTSVRALALSGTAAGDSLGSTVQLEWADRPGQAVPVSDGAIAGALSVLAPANAGGSGGAIAEAAASYNAFAGKLRDDVNALHNGAQTSTGAVADDFFGAAGANPALTLAVLPRSVGEIGIGAGAGRLDNSIADKISQLGTGTESPDSLWASIVTGIGVESRGAQQREALASTAEASALANRASQASVSLDEENVSLLTNQHAYQAAARVMTAVDEALDVLINRTGLVGR